jgi:predicted nucleotidyltransferase
VWGALDALAESLNALYGNPAPELILYGSQARGDAREESDVDVLLLFPHPVRASAEIRRVSPLLAEINLRYGVLVSVLPTDRQAFEKAEGAFWLNVRREGVRVGAV